MELPQQQLEEGVGATLSQVAVAVEQLPMEQKVLLPPLEMEEVE
jgi:hypothetical protein